MKYRLLTKHKDWEYESEYRFILYNRKPGNDTVERIDLKGIYLGLNCEEETKQRIKSMAEQRKDNVKIYSLNLSDNEYQMQYQPY